MAIKLDHPDRPGLEAAGLENREINALIRSGLYSVAEVAHATDARLKRCRGVGPAAFARIRACIPKRKETAT